MTVSMTETAASTGWGVRQGTATWDLVAQTPDWDLEYLFFFPLGIGNLEPSQAEYSASLPPRVTCQCHKSKTWLGSNQFALHPCSPPETRSQFSSGGHPSCKPKEGLKDCPGRLRGKGCKAAAWRGRELLMGEEMRSWERKNSYGR